MPITLRVELSLQGTSKSSLEEADFSNFWIDNFSNFWIERTFIRHKEMYAILVIRLKQSKSLHLIQTRLRCDDFDNTQLSWTLFFPLSCSWVSEVSIENFNWYFHSDFKLSRNFRTSNLHLKDFSLMHDVLLIFYPRTRQFLASGTKGGNSIWHEKKIASFRFQVDTISLRCFIYNSCV